MQNLRNIIPSANMLFAFEAAARHNSFTLAANELNVSQPAVSHAIKMLEKNLGVKLFERTHRRIELTREGRRFYTDVQVGLEHIYYAAHDLQMDRVRESITISGSTLFMQYWLLPKLNQFEEKFPQLDIRMHTTDRDVSLLTEGIDISVRLGDGKWPDYDVTFFADEVIYPVCSPEYINKNPEMTLPSDLLAHRLLYVDEPFRIRMTWSDWFRRVGVAGREIQKAIRFNDAQICLQSVLKGQGIALGWHHIVAPMIARGELVAPLYHPYQGSNAFYLLTPRIGSTTRDTKHICEWMLGEIAAQGV